MTSIKENYIYITIYVYIHLHLRWTKNAHLILEEMSVYSKEIRALENKTAQFCEHGPVLKHTKRPRSPFAPEPAFPAQLSDPPFNFDTDPV